MRNNLWVRTGDVDGGGFAADHNGFFETGSIGLAGAGDVTGDPGLDASYRLSSSSPMVDAGTDVGLAFVGSAPDIGWDEVGDDPCAEAATVTTPPTETTPTPPSTTGTPSTSTPSTLPEGQPDEDPGTPDEGGCGCGSVGFAPGLVVGFAVVLVGARRRTPAVQPDP